MLLDGADDGGQEEDLDEKKRGTFSGRGHTSRNAEPPPTCLAVQIKGPVAGRLRGRFFGLREAVVVVFTKFLTRNIHVWPTGLYGLLVYKRGVGIRETVLGWGLVRKVEFS